MPKHKIIRVSEKKLRNDAKNEIINFIQNRYLKGLDTQLQDIQNEFGKPPYELSEGTVINYLNELVEKRKISTWKQKNLRYYGPPKIPIPIKVGIAISAITITLGLIIDTLLSPEWIYTHIYLASSKQDTPMFITTRPLVIYILSITFILCTIWHITTRKIYK